MTVSGCRRYSKNQYMTPNDNGQPQKFNPRKYKIPGINPRYNLAVGLFSAGVGVVVNWFTSSAFIDKGLYTFQIAAIAFVVMTIISTIAVLIERVIQRVRR